MRETSRALVKDEMDPLYYWKEKTVLFVQNNDSLASEFSDAYDNTLANFIYSPRGANALQIIKDSTKPIQVVVVDFNLHDCLGNALARKIHAIDKKIVVLMLSSYYNVVIENECNRSGTTLIVKKPFKLKKLAEIIEKYVGE